MRTLCSCGTVMGYDFGIDWTIKAAVLETIEMFSDLVYKCTPHAFVVICAHYRHQVALIFTHRHYTRHVVKMPKCTF